MIDSPAETFVKNNKNMDLYPPVPVSELSDIKRIVDGEINRFDSYLIQSDNWKIFKEDTKELTRWIRNTKEPDIYWENNLFGPVGLMFENGYASVIVAETRTFNTKFFKDKWLNENRPLIYTIIHTKSQPIDTDTFEPIENVPQIERFIVRYFKEVGKLPLWKYYLQYFIGRCNFKFIRPFLYRLLVVK